MYHNIEKASWRGPRQYVGYGAGVWRISPLRDRRGFSMVRVSGGSACYFDRKTLKELSIILSNEKD